MTRDDSNAGVKSAMRVTSEDKAIQDHLVLKSSNLKVVKTTKDKEEDVQINKKDRPEGHAISQKEQLFDGCEDSTFPQHLSSILQPIENYSKKSSKNVLLLDTYFRQVSTYCTLLWISLIIFSYTMCPNEKIKRLDHLEQYAVTLASTIQFIAFSSRILPYLVLRSESSVNGLWIISSMVQFVSMMTNFFMATFPSPVMIDPVTSRRVHMLRWCEWIPLAFAMTFMTEAVGLKDVKKNIGDVVKLALSQSLSTLAGILFPFCSKGAWITLMCISTFLFCFMFPRLYFKRQLFKHQKEGKTVEELENYNRVKYSFQLLYMCTVMWSMLVTSYFIAAFAPFFVPKESFVNNPAYNMLSECSVDVIIKVLYLTIINKVQEAIFDDKARSRRRLEELRNMMAVVWESSSDIIAVSTRRSNDSGIVTTMVSPTIKNSAKVEDQTKWSEKNAILFELKIEGDENEKAESSKPFSISFLNSEGEYTSTNQNESITKAVSSIGDVITKAWESNERECLFMHNLITLDGSVIQAEARLNKFEEHSLIVVLRDISERHMRFEAEKKVITETTARMKDAEANRFTRHEVKNGLLAAIELCGGLKESFTEGHESGERIPRSGSNNSLGSLSSHPDTSRYLHDLNATLHEVLDTVLAEAMSREVIYEVYRPVLERIDIAAIISESLDPSNRDRFPIECDPLPFPEFYFDSQLLKYIHRNAMSNAIKYGKNGGVIRTELTFDSKTSELTMNVINLPGEGHSLLLDMGADASEAVFVQGNRLHKNIDKYKRRSHISSGDGAWIVQKCAKTLGGKCTISFLKDSTVFSFKCHADPHNACASSKFQVPADTYGIVIDDSKVQRKLMARLLSSLGVREDRSIILGKDGKEIRSFEQYVVNLVLENPKSYFLIIVDENLDIDDSIDDAGFGIDSRLSGSQCVENIRSQLPEENEKQILTLIRSANASAKEFALYNARAHGFIAKAPMKSDHMIDLFRHLWIDRFREEATI